MKSDKIRWTKSDDTGALVYLGWTPELHWCVLQNADRTADSYLQTNYAYSGAWCAVPGDHCNGNCGVCRVNEDGKHK